MLHVLATYQEGVERLFKIAQDKSAPWEQRLEAQEVLFQYILAAEIPAADDKLFFWFGYTTFSMACDSGIAVRAAGQVYELHLATPHDSYNRVNEIDTLLLGLGKNAFEYEKLRPKNAVMLVVRKLYEHLCNSDMPEDGIECRAFSLRNSCLWMMSEEANLMAAKLALRFNLLDGNYNLLEDAWQGQPREDLRAKAA